MDNVKLGRRIRAHRLAAGLSLRELSSRVPVSAQALSQYENGMTTPRSEVLESVADALGTTVARLSRQPEREWLGSVEIVQSRGGRRKILRKVEESLAAMTERSLSLEQKLGGGFPSPSLPVMEELMPVPDAEDVEELAQNVRRRWGLGTGPLPQLVSLFEARGIRVFETFHEKDMGESGAWSAFVWLAGGSWSELPVILVNGALSGEEKRFLLCHELGHMVLPRPWRHVLAGDVREELANWFAGALLMPASALRDQLGRKRRTLSRYELGELRRQFGIDEYRIARRCRQAGIISRDVLRDLVEEYRRGEWSEGLSAADLGLSPEEESSTRLRRLAVRAVTEGVMTSEEAAAVLDVEEVELDRLIGSPRVSSRRESAQAHMKG